MTTMPNPEALTALEAILREPASVANGVAAGLALELAPLWLAVVRAAQELNDTAGKLLNWCDVELIEDDETRPLMENLEQSQLVFGRAMLDLDEALAALPLAGPEERPPVEPEQP